MALTLSLLLALAPNTFAASKAPRQTHAQKMKAKKNKAKARKFAKRAKASHERVN
jgi:hypothetical protein